MTRGPIATVGIASLLTLSACNGDTADDQITVTQTVTAEATGASAPVAAGSSEDTRAIPDEAALELFHETDFWQAADTDTLANFSETVCDAYDVGVDPTETNLRILKELVDAGMKPGDVAASLIYAASWKCPEHSDKTRLTD